MTQRRIQSFRPSCRARHHQHLPRIPTRCASLAFLSLCCCRVAPPRCHAHISVRIAQASKPPRVAAFVSLRRLGGLRAGPVGTHDNDLASESDQRLARVTQLLEYWRGCELRKAGLSSPPHYPPVPRPHYSSSSRRYPTRWLTQFAVVAERAWLYKLRSPDAVVSQFFASVIMSVLMGSFFYAMPLTQVRGIASDAPCTRLMRT